MSETGRMAFDPDALVPAPHAPPRAWFEDVPDWFDPNGPLVQIDTESGRVAAIVAPYGECILDGSQNCWTPPPSQTAYEYAHVGTMVCEDGSKVRIANVGGGIPHANLTASSSVAADHYANTASRRMIGRYTDSPENGGILFLGSMWPGTTNRDVVEVVASALSGDWRWIQSLNDYEMVGSQLVNNPGFRPRPGMMPVRAALEFTAVRPAVVASASGGPAPVLGVWEAAPMSEIVTEKMARVAAAVVALQDDGIEDLEMPLPFVPDLKMPPRRGARVAKAGRPNNPMKVVDGDGDGRVKDGTKMERAATPAEMAAGKLLRQAKKLMGGKKGGKKGGKSGKPSAGPSGTPNYGRPAPPKSKATPLSSKGDGKPSKPGKSGKGGGDAAKAAQAKLDEIKAKDANDDASWKKNGWPTSTVTERTMRDEQYRDAVNAARPTPRSKEELADESISPVDMTDAEIDSIGVDEAMRRLNDRSGWRGKKNGVELSKVQADRESAFYQQLAKKKAGGGPPGFSPEEKAQTQGTGLAEPVKAQLRSEYGEDLPGVESGAGTKEDPFVVSDMESAVKLIHEGKHYIKLNRPDEVSTLMDRLQVIGDDAYKKGEKAPLYDLCKVTVPGTNLFCTESKGYDRVQMPQLKTKTPTPGSMADGLKRDKQGEVDLAPAFFDFLTSEKGVTVEPKKKIKASHLKATQGQLKGADVAGIMGAMERGDLGEGSIIVTSDGYIVDGHHRWAATVALESEGKDFEIEVTTIDADIISVLEWANKWAPENGSPPQTAALRGRPCRNCGR